MKLNLIKNSIHINFPHLQDYLIHILLVGVITYLLFHIVCFVTHHFFKRLKFMEEKRKQTIEMIIHNTAKWTCFVVMAVVIINPFVDLKNILVAGGALGVVVAIGAQSVIKDLFYGFFFIVEGQFKKGDFVNINDDVEGGVIEDSGFRAVKIRLTSGKLMTIANGEVKKITNGNVEKRRIFESIIVSFRENPNKIKNLLQEVCDELNSNQTDFLKKDKDGLFEEAYHVYGLSSLDSTTFGYKLSIAATVNDTNYVEAVQSAKELIAEKLYENQVRMPEQQVYYQTRLK